jgi:pimeloyl-ACP methyl ester carboxylesterase
MSTMTRITVCAALLSWTLFTAAAPGPAATIWTVVGFDPPGDGRKPAMADAAQLSYRYDQSDGTMWFRLSLFGRFNVEAFGVNVAVDTGTPGRQKANWWGTNKTFTFDRLITAAVTRTGERYTGTIGISDAAGASRMELTSLGKDNVQIRVDGHAILIGVKRDELSDKMNIVASVGSIDDWNDDLPNMGSAAIDLSAPRATRGLREIDVSRNNLTFARDQQVVREGARPRITRKGRGSTAMVLVPGVYSGRDVFDGFISRNSSQYTFYVITPPGLDGTLPRAMPPPGTSYGAFTWTRQLAADITSLIEREHLVRPIILAHGFPGSLAGEELAFAHSPRIGGVVEVASVAVTRYPSSRTPGSEAGPEERVAVMDASWAQQWFKYVTPETWESNNYPAEMFTNDAERAERVRKEIEAVALPVKIRYLVESMASDHRPSFSALQVPVLVLRPGFNSTILANPMFGWFRQSFQEGWNAYPANPRVEMKTIADARALMLDDQPALADEAIATFVAAARDAPKR